MAELEERGGQSETGSEETLFEEAAGEGMDCSLVSTKCELTSNEEHKVRRAGKPGGDLLDRTQGDPDKNLSLQLTNYGVNDWRAGKKELHSQGLHKVLKFIGERAPQIAASPLGIEITITARSELFVRLPTLATTIQEFALGWRNHLESGSRSHGHRHASTTIGARIGETGSAELRE